MQVIKQLQTKFVFSMILIEMVVFAAILLSLNIAITKRESNDTKDFLIFLANNNGHSPTPRLFDDNMLPTASQNELLLDIDATSSASRETPEPFLHNITDIFRIERTSISNLRNYFSVKVTQDGHFLELIQDFPLNYTNSEINHLVNEIFGTKKRYGTLNGVTYYIKDLRNNQKLICMLNRNSELKTLSKLYVYSSLLYLLSIMLSILISIPISKYMIKPTEEAFRKQKQFIADASHELKTPVAVIGANLDVLESEIKNNKWLNYIKAENKRMGELVRDLLYLAKNDAGRNELTFSDFDFSNAVENSVLPFEVVAFEAEKTLEFNIQKGINYNGDEKSLKQVFIILLDNALKNSENGAKITIQAFTENQRIIYKIRNTGTGIRKDELEKIFLRFYRSDSSRVRKTGGSGLGLAIARAIATDHGGTLTADSEYGEWAEFTLSLPKRK